MKRAKIQRFSRQVQNDPALQQQVTRWLSKNPPPHDWQGSRVEWAFLEMPCTMPHEGVMDFLLGR